MLARHHRVEDIPPERHHRDRIGQLVHKGNSQVGYLAPDILEDSAVDAFPDTQLDRWPGDVVLGNDARQRTGRDRLDRGHNDLPALLVGKIAHAADGNA